MIATGAPNMNKYKNMLQEFEDILLENYNNHDYVIVITNKNTGFRAIYNQSEHFKTIYEALQLLKMKYGIAS